MKLRNGVWLTFHSDSRRPIGAQRILIGEIRMPGPDVIVIGAQKCGTTSLYEDLKKLSGVVVGDKESNVLSRNHSSAGELESAYDELFSKAAQDDLRIEVGADYTMFPMHKRAIHNFERLKSAPKLVYIVRDPIKRTMSQHYHDLVYGNAPEFIEDALKDRPSLIDTSCYATQLRRWMKLVDIQRIRVIRFEDYMSDRKAGLADVARFIGVDSLGLDPGDEAYNNANEVVVPGRAWRKFNSSSFYRTVIRPSMPTAMRERIKRFVSPPAPRKPAEPSATTIQCLVDRLEPEVAELAEILGEGKWWDLSVHSNNTK